MVKLRINNTEVEVSDGLTVLEAAGLAGIAIPTLCNNSKLPHYSSCMVCMVRDLRTGNFTPSCSALVQESMDIDCSSEEVISIRRKAVELLLSEHRAECEAPCKVVCPGNYNIPLMNRLLKSGDFDGAVQLSIKQIETFGFLCTDCQGYCENACRRKKVDIPVSIRNLQIFIWQKIKDESKVINQSENSSRPDKRKLSRKFESRIGKIQESEFMEWLKESENDVERFRDIKDNNSAASESASCMHCDCRAVDNCRLRDIADKFSIKDPRGKQVNAPIQKKININTGLIFENAKCIKCGLCVRLCDTFADEPGLCFINRGFVSIISEPITDQFDNILKTHSKEVIDICPTGALSHL